MRAAITVMACLVSTLAAAQARKDSPAAAQADANATACFEEAVRLYDDRVSDARTVAIGLAERCRYEMRRLVALRAGKPLDHPEVDATLNSRTASSAIVDRATVVVLRMRAARRAADAP